MKIKVLDNTEREKIKEQLESEYGAHDAFDEYVMIESGEGRVKVTTREVLDVLPNLRGVVNLGLYVVKRAKDGIALSVEGSQLLANKITSSVVELSYEEAEKWMQGTPIERQVPGMPKFVVAKMGGIFLGSGRASRDGKVYSQIPKWRRLPE